MKELRFNQAVPELTTHSPFMLSDCIIFPDFVGAYFSSVSPSVLFTWYIPEMSNIFKTIR